MDIPRRMFCLRCAGRCHWLSSIRGATGIYYYNGSDEDDSNSKTKGWQHIVYPIIVGLSGMLLGLGVRLLSYDKYPRAGIATHVIVAGIFQMFSIIYCFTTIQLATTVFGEWGNDYYSP